MEREEKFFVLLIMILTLAFAASNGVFLISKINPKLKPITNMQQQGNKLAKDLTTMNEYLENIYFDMAGMHGKIAGMEQSLARIETNFIEGDD